MVSHIGVSLAATDTDPIGQGHGSYTKKVALVIGNSHYQSGPLKNPINDAEAFAAKLRTYGFDVLLKKDVQVKMLGKVLVEFKSKITPGSVAVVFYAGHGLQIKGTNYLPAVDADITSEQDAPYQSFDLNKIFDLLDESKSSLNLVFLDACRNNPFARSFRSSDRGLARVNAPSGTLISYATRPGSVASDGDGGNGLYTTHLLRNLDTPNMPIELMLKRVIAGVKRDSKGMQEPWIEGSLDGDFSFNVVKNTEPIALVPSTIPLPQPIPVVSGAISEKIVNLTANSNRDKLARLEDTAPRPPPLVSEMVASATIMSMAPPKQIIGSTAGGSSTPVIGTAYFGYGGNNPTWQINLNAGHNELTLKYDDCSSCNAKTAVFSCHVPKIDKSGKIDGVCVAPGSGARFISGTFPNVEIKGNGRAGNATAKLLPSSDLEQFQRKRAKSPSMLTAEY